MWRSSTSASLPFPYSTSSHSHMTKFHSRIVRYSITRREMTNSICQHRDKDVLHHRAEYRSSPSIRSPFIASAVPASSSSSCPLQDSIPPPLDPRSGSLLSPPPRQMESGADILLYESSLNKLHLYLSLIGYPLLIPSTAETALQGTSRGRNISGFSSRSCILDLSRFHSDKTTNQFDFVLLYLIGCIVPVLVASSSRKQ